MRVCFLMMRILLLLLVVVIASGCSEAGSIAGPADPEAQLQPELMVADPAVTSPGGVVALTFPEETTRGVLFILEQRVGNSWAHRFDLLSDGPGAGWKRSWHPVGAEPIAVEDIGVGGPGPDRVPIPEVAEPGDYRICTGNAGENFCVPIRIGE